MKRFLFVVLLVLVVFLSLPASAQMQPWSATPWIKTNFDKSTSATDAASRIGAFATVSTATNVIGRADVLGTINGFAPQMPAKPSDVASVLQTNISPTVAGAYNAFPDIVVANDGTWYIFFFASPTGSLNFPETNCIALAISTNQGSSYTTSLILSNANFDVEGFSPGINDSGDLLLAYSLLNSTASAYFITRTNGTWSNPVSIPTNGIFTTSLQPSGHILQIGSVYHCPCYSGSSNGIVAAYDYQSPDKGITWTPYLIDATTNCNEPDFVAGDPNHLIAVTRGWTNGFSKYNSIDGGKTWVKSDTIRPVGQDPNASTPFPMHLRVDKYGRVIAIVGERGNILVNPIYNHVFWSIASFWDAFKSGSALTNWNDTGLSCSSNSFTAGLDGGYASAITVNDSLYFSYYFAYSPTNNNLTNAELRFGSATLPSNTTNNTVNLATIATSLTNYSGGFSVAITNGIIFVNGVNTQIHLASTSGEVDYNLEPGGQQSWQFGASSAGVYLYDTAFRLLFKSGSAYLGGDVVADPLLKIDAANNTTTTYLLGTKGSIPNAVTVGASPFTFTNSLTNNLECYFSGGTAYSVTKNGVAVFGSLVGDAYFVLQPTNRCIITYTVAPTFYTNRW